MIFCVLDMFHCNSRKNSSTIRACSVAVTATQSGKNAVSVDSVRPHPHASPPGDFPCLPHKMTLSTTSPALRLLRLLYLIYCSLSFSASEATKRALRWKSKKKYEKTPCPGRRAKGMFSLQMESICRLLGRISKCRSCCARPA